MRTRTRFFAAALAVAVAAPIAISQAPTPDTSSTRILPSTAASYAEYQGNVTQVMSKDIGSAAELNRHVQTFGSANVNQLSSGWISYGAILAAQNPEFAEEVRKVDAAYGRERVMLGFQNSPSYARTLKGGEVALQAALTVNAHDTARILSAGTFVKEQSYSMQQLSWGKSRAPDPNKTASSLRTASTQDKPASATFQQAFSAPDLNTVLASMAASPTTAQSIWDKVAVLTVSAPANAFQTVSPVVAAPQALKVKPGYDGTANRMLTLGAQHILSAEQTHPVQMRELMADPMSRDCLAEAQRNFFGCVSAATHNDALAGCLAKHGLQIPKEETRSIGLCLSEIAR